MSSSHTAPPPDATTQSPLHYTRDVMLALYVHTVKNGGEAVTVPAEMTQFPLVYAPEPTEPMAFAPLSDLERQLMESGHINSETGHRRAPTGPHSHHPGGARGNYRGRGRGQHHHQGGEWHQQQGTRRPQNSSNVVSPVSPTGPLADDIWDVPGHDGAREAGTFANGSFALSSGNKPAQPQRNAFQSAPAENPWRRAPAAPLEAARDVWASVPAQPAQNTSMHFGQEHHQHHQISRPAPLPADPAYASRTNTANVMLGKSSRLLPQPNAQPPQRHGPSPESLLFLYKDPSDNVQGPFTAAEMDQWYDAGYFPDQLLVKRLHDHRFMPLLHFISRFSAGGANLEFSFVNATDVNDVLRPEPSVVAVPPTYGAVMPPPQQQQQQQQAPMRGEERAPLWNRGASAVSAQPREQSLAKPPSGNVWGTAQPAQPAVGSGAVKQPGGAGVIQSVIGDVRKLDIGAAEKPKAVASHAEQQPKKQQQQQQQQQQQPQKQLTPAVQQQAPVSVKPASSNPPANPWKAAGNNAGKTLAQIQQEEEAAAREAAAKAAAANAASGIAAASGKRYSDTLAKGTGSVWAAKPSSVTQSPTMPTASVAAPSSAAGSRPGSSRVSVDGTAATANNSHASDASARSSSVATDPSAPSGGQVASAGDLLSWGRVQLKPLGARMDVTAMLEVLASLEDVKMICEVVHDSLGPFLTLVDPQLFLSEYLTHRHRMKRLPGTVKVPPPPVSSMYAVQNRSSSSSSGQGSSGGKSGGSGGDQGGFMPVVGRKAKQQAKKATKAANAAPVGVGGRPVVGLSKN